MDLKSISAIQSDTISDPATRKKQLRQSCREFESVMIEHLMKTMRDGIMRAEEPEHAREVYEDMLSGHISKEVGQGGFLGIGDMLYAKLEPQLNANQPVRKQDPPDSEQAAPSVSGHLSGETAPRNGAPTPPDKRILIVE
ncbi:MAG: hypothetical protein AAGU11_15620 [Syntrophobacteraceae bacterium]